MLRASFLILVLLPNMVLARTATDSLRVYEGLKVTAVVVTGADVTKPWVVLRELHTTEGAVFSVETVKADIQRLMNLSIFSSVRVNAQETDRGVGVEFVCREMPWVIPYIKLQYTQTNGFSIGPTVSSVNLFGRDISLSAYVLVGGTNQFSIIMTWPWIARNHLSLDWRWIQMNRWDPLLDFEEDSREFTPWIGSYIRSKGRIQGTFAYFRMTSQEDSITLDPDNTDHLLRLGGRIGYDSRDNWRDPHNGWWTQFELIKTGDPLPGQGDFWSAVFDVRRYHSVTPRNNLMITALYTPQSGIVNVDVPQYLQYFMGGPNSVRGYDVDIEGKELFGKNQIIFTLQWEYLPMPLEEYVLFKRWSANAGLKLAFFADWGTAWSTNQDPWSRGIFGFGVGVHLLVPAVDKVRFEFGFNEDFDFVFGFGVRPKPDMQRMRIR